MEKTEAEKWDFLEALYIHGTDLDSLRTALPTWTTAQAEHVIKRFRARAKRKLECEEEALKSESLNHWVKVTENLHQLQGTTNYPWWRKGRKKLDEEPKDHTPILSKALMFAACFEDHYQGSAPDDPNYSEIYRYLAQLMQGKEPTKLTPGSAAKILEMLSKMKKVVTHESGLVNLKHLQDFELSYLPSVSKKKSGKGKQKSEEMAVTENHGPEVGSPPLSCPLFEEGEDARVVLLDPCDPYYELKKESMVSKIQEKQEQEAINLQHIPGLNPMEMPNKLLVKPAIAILDMENLI